MKHFKEEKITSLKTVTTEAIGYVVSENDEVVLTNVPIFLVDFATAIDVNKVVTKAALTITTLKHHHTCVT